MSAAENQLRAIKSEDFRVITIDSKVYLSILHSDTSPSGSVDCEEEFSCNDITRWLKKWNIDELIELKMHGECFVSRKLSFLERDHFEISRVKLLRCKEYAQNYTENTLMDTI